MTVQGDAWPVGKCDLVFDNDCEIVTLTGNHKQAASIADRTPGISVPVGLSPAFQDMIQKGCYVRVEPGSGFPFVELRNGDDGGKWGRGGTRLLPVKHDRIVRAGPEGIWVPACENLLIFPPTERYLRGYSTTEALYPIGGWVSNSLTNYLRWEVTLEASQKPFGDVACPSIWKCSTVKQFITTGADLTMHTPIFPMKQAGSASGATHNYCGKFTVNGISVITKLTAYFAPFDYLRNTNTYRKGLAVDATQGAGSDIQARYLTGTSFNIQLKLDWVDPDEADIPVSTDVEVQL